MAFRQPASLTIRAADFRANAFRFPVESVLQTQPDSGELVLEASAGYLLTTPANPAPNARQTVSYALQPDGSRVAQAQVTLLASEPTPPAGTVTLRDPLGATQVLVIDPTAEVGRLPILTVSSPDLSFKKTDPGEETFAILKIAQQYADVPLTLTTDDPGRFTVATGIKQLNFTPSLTFTPSATGTYVHVRYAPDRPGRHVAKLFIEAPYDMKVVTLRGRGAGLVPLPTSARSARAIPAATAVAEPRPTLGQRLALPTILLLGGLAYAGYAFRCQLAPGLCREPAVSAPALVPADTTAAPRPVDPLNAGVNAKTTDEPSASVKRTRRKSPESTEAEDGARRSDNVRSGNRASAVGGGDPARSGRLSRSKRSTSSTPTLQTENESDLEKELNKDANR